MGVDLERSPGRLCSIQHRASVQFDSRPATHAPSVQVTDHVHRRMAECRDDTSRLFLSRQVEVAVDRGDTPVIVHQEPAVVVQGAVPPDVEFDPMKNFHPRISFLESADAPALGQHL